MVAKKYFDDKKEFSFLFRGRKDRILMEKISIYCTNFDCVSEEDVQAESVFNIVLYENKEKILLYNLAEKKIFKISKKQGLREIDFKEAIREIDVIPEKEPSWKRLQILKLAKDLGIFG